MAYNLIECNREQMFLMPVSLREWLPEGHLAWFVLDAVEAIDLSKFYLKYRSDGWGRAAYDPRMMVSLLLYAYCLGVRSSRQIERACEVDVAFRVIAGNVKPDYSTVCRFRAENEKELGMLFTEVLRLCAEAGLVKAGVVVLDGTKIKANASLSANRTQEHIEEEVRKMLAEAREKDEEEDRLFGKGSRGDEMPEELKAAGIEQEIESELADAGYWSEGNITQSSPTTPEFLIATTKDWKQRKAMREKGAPRGRIPKDLSSRDRMERKLLTKRGRSLYKLRGQTVEPVFGQIKSRGCDTFMRRGLEAVRSEWKLVCATHNPMKLFRSGAAKLARMGTPTGQVLDRA